jgi:hypothetical protein
MSASDGKYTQTVIIISTPQGNVPVSVSCGVDAAIKELEKTTDGTTWAKFTSPSAFGMLQSRPLMQPPGTHVVMVFEQEVTVPPEVRAQMAGISLASR